MNIFKKKKASFPEPAIPPDARAAFSDMHGPEFWDLYNVCKPFTLTSVERIYSLFRLTKYILQNNIPGDFVECGVWKGGSALLIAKTGSEKKLSILLNRIKNTGRIAIKNY